MQALFRSNLYAQGRDCQLDPEEGKLIMRRLDQQLDRVLTVESHVPCKLPKES